METIKVGLVNGRHEMPVHEYIFDHIEDVLDFEALNKQVNNFLQKKVGIGTSFCTGLSQADDYDVACLVGEKALVVYVTGLTAATAAVIAACARNGVALTLMHYDASTGNYKAQEIF